MPHNWPPPGGVDPLAPIETPLTPTMLREVPPVRTFRFFRAATITKTVFENADAPVLDPSHEMVFTDPPPTPLTGLTGIQNNFVTEGIRIVNDGPGTVEYSFDGITVHGSLQAGESVVDDARRERRIFFRKPVGGMDTDIRVWAW